MLDRMDDPAGAERSYREGLAIDETNDFLNANLAWALIAQNKHAELDELRLALEKSIDTEGLSLIDAAAHLASNNLGNALEKLELALEHGLEPDRSAYFEDLLRFVRFSVQQDYGEKLIDWFEETGNHQKYAPVYSALVAFQRGERFLNDVNPEVRATAKSFLDFLVTADNV